MKTKSLLFISILIVFMSVCAAVAACTVTKPSLSATYDAAHIIEEGDSLDSVKLYLAVYYTDEHNETHRLGNEEYELSGTLIKGSNTLTVSYKNLQAVVSVTVKEKSVTHKHSYTDWGHNDSEHWRVCPEDGAVDENTRTEHSFDDNGVCECGYKRSKPFTVSRITLSVDKNILEGGDEAIFTVSTDPTGYENKVKLVVSEGTDAGKIVGAAFVPDTDVDCKVTVYAELDGVRSDALTIFVWRSGSTQNVPASVDEICERLDIFTGYSAHAYYVKGVVASSLKTAPTGYTFEICDESDPDKRITVVNAVFDSSINLANVKVGDAVVVYGNIYSDIGKGLRVPQGGNCRVVDWTGEITVKVTVSVDRTELNVGETANITIVTSPSGYEDEVIVYFELGSTVGHLEGTTLYAEQSGQCQLKARLTLNGQTFYSNTVTVHVRTDITENVTVTLKADKYLIEYADNTYVYAAVAPSDYVDQLKFEITDGADVATLVGNSQTSRSILPLKAGYVTVVAYVGRFCSDPVTIQIIRDDPYTNMGASGFYNNNYKPAADLEDSYWRTKHNLMSGSIAEQDPTPTLSSNRPMQDDKYVRNIDENYYDNGNSYKVIDHKGNVVNTIFKGGAYVTLEEVAAYVYAWGDVPANYITSNKGDPKSNAWGMFLRLNHNLFSGDTSRYPYEPVLPNISGCGGTYQYYEIDIGTTGTHTPGYTAAPYNNGNRITRGAARIVYARYEGSRLLSPSERYVFYTYNHYNDFQEYLNYQGGWGEMFGNITGGGQYNSGRNPSPYVDVAKSSFGCKG